MITDHDMRKVTDADLRQGFAPNHAEHMPTADLVTCGDCHRTWCDSCTPTPAARCPYEYEHVGPPPGPGHLVGHTMDALDTLHKVQEIATEYRQAEHVDPIALLDRLADLVLGES